MTKENSRRVRELVWRAGRLADRLARAYVRAVVDEIAIERGEAGRDCAVCVYQMRCAAGELPRCVPPSRLVAPEGLGPGRYGLH